MLDYALEALRAGAGARPAPVPVEVLAQARRAAALGVPLDAVLRRYLAGYVVLEEELLLAPGVEDPSELAVLRRALVAEAAALDHVIAAVAAEYRDEEESRAAARDRRRAACVRRLLAGHLVDRRELGYDLEGRHLGMIACGTEAEERIRALASSLGRRLLLVRADSSTVWAWFGGADEPCRPSPAEVSRLADAGVRVALGEVAEGIAGWRTTHRQARAAFALLLRSDRELMRYRDVALLAAVAENEVLVDWLQASVLDPLAARSDGAELLRALRAYFGAARNASSAAAALGVSRHTVTRRLHEVEERIGGPLEAIASQLEFALELKGLRDATPSRQSDLRSPPPA